MGQRPLRQDRAVVARATSITAAAYQIFRPLIFMPTRVSADVTHARQMAMYLANCSGGVSIVKVAELFGRNIHTTTAAIRQIEDHRDDKDFDEFVSELEAKFNGTDRTNP